MLDSPFIHARRLNKRKGMLGHSCKEYFVSYDTKNMISALRVVRLARQSRLILVTCKYVFGVR